MWMQRACEGLSAAGAVMEPWLVDAGVKGAVILLLTAGVVGVMRRASAAARHWVWFLGMGAVLMMPMLSAGLPGWHVLPRWGNVAEAGRSADAPAAVAGIGGGDEVRFQRAGVVADGTVRAEAARVKKATVVAERAMGVTWQGWVVLAWIVGGSAYLGYMGLGFVSLWRLERRALRMTEGNWGRVVGRLGEELAFGRKVELLKSAGRAMPMTWGIWRTRLLLPAESGAWSGEEFRMVVLHELAHAKRRDCLTQLVVQVVCGIFWFNPLVWAAQRGMQSEREGACDDLVLRAGTKATTYAEQLLRIASEMPVARFSAAAIAMARPSKLEGRLLAIVDAGRNRRAVGWTALVVAGAGLLGVMVPLAILRAQEGEQVQARPPLKLPEQPARTFNSKLDLEVWITHDDETAQQAGMTPSAKDLEIPASNSWWATAIGTTTLEDIAKEAKAQKIPGLGLLMATDEGLELLKDDTSLRALLMGGSHVTDAGMGTLKEIKGLRIISVEGTRVTDAGLGELKELPNLYALNVAYNDNITDAGMEYLKDMKTLRILNIRGTAVTDEGLAKLQGLTGLQELFLTGLKVTDAGIAHVKGFKHMLRLRMEGTQVTDGAMENLKDMGELWELYLSRTHVTDAGLESLKGLTALRTLDLSGTQVTNEGLKSLKELRRLEMLNLVGTQVTDAGLEYLVGLDHLKSLELAKTVWTDAGLEYVRGLHALETLNLSGTKVTDAGLAHLREMLRLKELDLAGTEVTDAGLENLKGLGGLEKLDLSGTKITDAGLAYLEGLSGLVTLNLRKTTAITDEGLAHLKNLKGLKYLTLNGTQVTDAGLANLKDLTAMKDLFLGQTHVTDGGLEQLKGMTALMNLDVSQTGVSDAGLEVVKELKGITNIWVYQTEVTPAGRAMLKAALPNIAIH